MVSRLKYAVFGYSRSFSVKVKQKPIAGQQKIITFLRKDYKAFMPASGTSILRYFRNVPGLGLVHALKFAKRSAIKLGNSFENYPSKYMKSLLHFAEKGIQGSGKPVDLVVKKMEEASLTKGIKSGEIGALKFAKGLPSQGQRTKSNARTSKKVKAERIIFSNKKFF